VPFATVSAADADRTSRWQDTIHPLREHQGQRSEP
jgi:hypothetical protein